MKTLLSTLVMVISFTFINAQDWVKYEKKEAKYKIMFPSTPTETVKETKSITYKANAKIGLVTYSVSASVHKTNIEAIDGMAKRSFEAFVKALNGTVEEQTTFKIGDVEGISAKIKSEKGAFINYRIICIGKIQYQVYVTSVRKYAEADQVSKFFESFKPDTSSADTETKTATPGTQGKSAVQKKVPIKKTE